MIDDSLFDRLSSICGKENVSRDPDKLQSYSADASPFPSIRPGMIVTPASTEVVSTIIETCNETKTPVMPFGSAYSFTGLSNRKGSSTIVIDMKKMNQIIEIDESSYTVRAEAGIIVGNLSDQVKKRGYYLNTVAVPYYRDTLGGMISGVVGGGHPLYSTSFGLNNRDIISLRVVLPTGAVLETSSTNASDMKASAFMRDRNSPDMTGMFVGDGGIFGIKTEAVMTMHPIPPFWRSGAKIFTNFDDAYNALCIVSSSPEQLCDYLTMLSPEITEIYTPNLDGRTPRYGLIYYLQGFNENEMDFRARNAASILESKGGMNGTDALCEFSEGMRTGEMYWKTNEYTESMIRRASCAFFANINTFRDAFDSLNAHLRDRVKSESSTQARLTPAYVIHSVQRNCVWANLILNYDSEEVRQTVYEIIRDINRLAAQMGVTFETHGGYTADLMGNAWPKEFRGMMQAVKSALDPNQILNPGLWFTET
jgi:FAD/FMN-containing dehydrogenase